MSDAVRAAAEVVAKRLGKLKPRVAIVLGSGLAGVADAVRDAVRIPYKEIPGRAGRRAERSLSFV